MVDFKNLFPRIASYIQRLDRNLHHPFVNFSFIFKTGQEEIFLFQSLPQTKFSSVEYILVLIDACFLWKSFVVLPIVLHNYLEKAASHFPAI